MKQGEDLTVGFTGRRVAFRFVEHQTDCMNLTFLSVGKLLACITVIIRYEIIVIDSA